MAGAILISARFALFARDPVFSAPPRETSARERLLIAQRRHGIDGGGAAGWHQRRERGNRRQQDRHRVQPESAPFDCGIALEPAAPEKVADDRHARCPFTVFAAPEEPPATGVHANDVKEIRADHSAAQPFGSVAAGEADLRLAVAGKLANRPGGPLDIKEVGAIQPADRTRRHRQPPQIDQGVRIREGERIKNPCLRHREHDNRAGNAEGDRQRRECGVTRISPERSARVLEILEGVFGEGNASLVAVLLFTNSSLDFVSSN